VLAYLLSRGCRRFVLWGRSMGAASAAMFLGAYSEVLSGAVVALVLDSPFTSMQGLAAEYTSSTKIPVPSLLLSPALHLLRQNVLSKYGFDILYISPLAAAARITVPTVVLSGSEDKIVPPALSESIYAALNGPKLRIFFNGGHNTHRPTVVFDAVRVVLTGADRCSVCLSV
jgi:pimeloyl-ACP methyl ester carboxylesterase